MKKGIGEQNIFLKSVFRQRVRTLIFFIIIAASAFAFVLRATEFIVIRDRIESISENFRSIGFLHLRDAPYGNILEGAEIIGASRYVGTQDRRRGFEAVLHDMHNTNTGGRVGDGGHILTGLEVSHIAIPERDVFSYFYATIDEVVIRNHPATGHFVELQVTVDEVLAGYLEHAYACAAGSSRGETRVRWYMELDATENPLENMVVGERYFIRAAFYWVSTHGRGMSANPPSLYGSAHILYLHPLTKDGLLYIHAPDGQIDFTSEEMAEIAAGIEQSNYNASVVWLRTTADMTMMPLTKEGIDTITLADGRFLNHEDYLQARPVAVINQRVAQMRDLGIGDTITVSVPREQRIVNLNTVMLFGAQMHEAWALRNENFVFGEGFLDFAILGQPGDYIIEELELEIVGIYRKLQGGAAAGTWAFSYIPALLGNYVYIPDSLLPPDFMPVDELHGYERYLWDLWYSFELSDTRNENAFLLDVRDELYELGLVVHLLPSGAENFWISAEPVLLSSTVNAVIFVAVMFLLFILVSFLYLGQRRRDFAIARALGRPAKLAVKQMCLPVAIFAIPAIIIGGISGWRFALVEAGYTVGAFAEFMQYYEAYGYYATAIELSTLWLVLQVFVMIAMILGMIFAGATITAKRPVLELLQGRSVKDKTSSVKDIEYRTAPQSAIATDTRGGTLVAETNTAKAQNIYSVAAGENNRGSRTDFTPHNTAKLNKIKASLQFIIKHIIRAPMKTALTALIAIMFIAALGFLQQTMVTTEREVDRLFDTTIVEGALVPTNPFLHGGDWGITLLQDTYENLANSDLFYSYYIEAQFSDFFLFHPGADGNFPVGEQGEFWDEFWFYIRHELLGAVALRTDPIFAFSDFDRFLERNGEQDNIAVPGIAAADIFDFDEMGLGVVTDPLDIHFGTGFCREDFVYDDQNLIAPIPVILSDLTLIRRELSVGDMAFLGHYFPALWRASERIEVPVQVIGWHNGSIDHPQGRNAVLMPMEAFQAIRGDAMSYFTFDFEVNPAHNREMQYVRDEIGSILRRGRQSTFMALSSALSDEELSVVAGQMEQNLALMLLLYPVIIAVSVAMGAGLALLLLMQSAKLAAILRVLGCGAVRTRTILSTEHTIVAIVGVLVAFIVMPIVGISFSSQLPLLAGLYVIGAAAGAIAGAIIITRKAPLELLQVRE